MFKSVFKKKLPQPPIAVISSLPSPPSSSSESDYCYINELPTYSAFNNYYTTFLKRLKSFANISNNLQLHIDLAKTGFYHDELLNKCICFCCGSQMNLYCRRHHYYTETDLWQMHYKKCPWVSQVAGDFACTQCHSQDRQICFLPCNHTILCKQCTTINNSSKCPQCNEIILNYVKIISC